MTHYQDEMLTLHLGDCLDIMATLPDESVDSIVTDPPYGLGFMGKEWDALPPGQPWAEQCLRVLKPGGHVLAFGGTRTWHRLAVAIEDAGFEIRDSIAWLYGSGFPKSLDVSKAIDKAAGAQREVIGVSKRHGGGVIGNGSSYEVSPDVPMLTAPATPDAQHWQGWGTALKPAFEPVVVARKPLIGTVAANVLQHGVGALNIDACRIDAEPNRPDGLKRDGSRSQKVSEGWDRPWKHDERADRNQGCAVHGVARCTICVMPGRWPANVALDETQANTLDTQSGITASPATSQRNQSQRAAQVAKGAEAARTGDMIGYADKGGASRFFYVAKAPQAQRPKVDGIAHPTVKPLDLMRWLTRLVTPPDGTVLDPFLGSGTTAQAALLEGFRCIGIEREPAYMALIEKRLQLDVPPWLRAA